jgi:transcriptional regulatory protein LEU3
MAARLHLQAFFLFDDPALEGYKDRIVALFSTAYNLVDLSGQLNSRLQGFFDYCPFFCYQTYVNAAFVLLKILTNGFFNLIIDARAGKQLLESSITGLRQMSVVNNDLPARLGDIIGFFCALPDLAVVGGVTLKDLQLKQVRNRLSMSVVYDCLWTWRMHFQIHQSDKDRSENIQDKSQSNPFLQRANIIRHDLYSIPKKYKLFWA